MFTKSFSGMFGTLFGKIWDLIVPCFSHPYIDVELRLDGYKQLNKRLISSKETIHVSEAVYDYDFRWDYVMVIKNNSSIPAFNLVIKELPVFLRITDPMERTISLRPFEKIELKCIVQHSETMNGHAVIQRFKQFPYFTDKIKMVIGYQNERHKQFYTTFVYDKIGQRNEYKK